MSLERFVQDIEGQLFAWGRRVLGDRREELREQVERQAEKVEGQRLALDEASAECESVRARVDQGKARLAQLPGLIEDSVRRGRSSQALVQAMELDNLRRSLPEDQATLERLDLACWGLQFELRQSKRQLARLRDDLAALDKPAST